MESASESHVAIRPSVRILLAFLGKIWAACQSGHRSRIHKRRSRNSISTGPVHGPVSKWADQFRLQQFLASRRSGLEANAIQEVYRGSRRVWDLLQRASLHSIRDLVRRAATICNSK